ncbi:MAG: LysR family transcriptional regulator [Burkholderiales bacterium]
MKTDLAKLQMVDSLTSLTDIQFVATIAESGSLSAAAKRLAVNHATVFRRLESFEARLGVKLFERSAGRYVPTVAGEELARAGVDIEEAATRSLLRVAGRDLRASGLVRLTTTESIASGLLAPLAAACRVLHPGIQIQVVADNSLYDLSRRDADIAIRPTRKPPQHLIGKKVGVLAMCAYGSRRYLQHHRSKDLSAHEWIAFDDARSSIASLEWLAAIKPTDQIAYRTNSHMGVAHACIAGAGLAVLPCFVGDREPALRRLGGPIDACANDLWILTHPDLRETVRIKTVFRALQEELEKVAPLLAGQRPHPRTKRR